MNHTEYKNIIEAAHKLTGSSAKTKAGAWEALRPWIKRQHGQGLARKINFDLDGIDHWCKPGCGFGGGDPRLLSPRAAYKKWSWLRRVERGGGALMRELGLKTRWENIQAGGIDDWERALVAEKRTMGRDGYNALVYSPINDHPNSLRSAWLFSRTWPLDVARKCAHDVERFGGDEHGGWVTRCDFDDKGRGEAINVDVYGLDDTQKLYVIQVRQFIRQNKNWYPQVRKSYFLIGYNENGNPFAHSIPAATVHAAIKRDPSPDSPVKAAQAWIWKINEDQLPHILRNGDVALIPATKVPRNNITIETGMKRIVDSHWIYSKEIRINGATYALNPTLRHLKGQHPTQKGKGWYKIMVADRASFHDFARPTID